MNKMAEFLNRFITIALPTARELNKWNPKSIDSTFNFNMGVKEYTDFIKLDNESVDQVKGIDIAFTIDTGLSITH